MGSDASPCSSLVAAGSNFLLWFGPTPRLAVADPDLIREIFVSRSELFDRYESHPLVRQLEGEGLVSLRGEKWAHHRKVITPTFHMDNLKVCWLNSSSSSFVFDHVLITKSITIKVPYFSPHAAAYSGNREECGGDDGEVVGIVELRRGRG